MVVACCLWFPVADGPLDHEWANDADRVTRTTPKWKSWWEENKKDYL